jgi:hypothetical protein
MATATAPKRKKKTAIEHLQPSKLSDQKELLKDDIQVDIVRLFIHGDGHLDVQSYVTPNSQVERTIEGASTLTLEVNDPNNDILNSGFLTNRTDIEIDGLYFRLRQVQKQGNVLSLIFEDREVSLLRQYNGYRQASRDQMTRAEFAHSLVKEVKETDIRFFCPIEHIKQEIATDPNSGEFDISRGAGVSAANNITVKHVKASQAQINNINTILQVGDDMRVGTFIEVSAIAAATQESSIINLAGGDRDSVGVFQQRNFDTWTHGGTRDRRNVADAARSYYEVARQKYEQSRHDPGANLTEGELAQAVQVSAFPDAYNQWVKEARHTVAEYHGQTDQTLTAMGTTPTTTGFSDSGYMFSRGTVDSMGRQTLENSWDCLNRLASEVQWRCFMVSGTVYFIDDPYLIRSRVRMVIDESTDGITSIDFDFDRNKKNSDVTVNARLHRWDAPPGSVVVIKNMGVINGRWLVNDITRPLYDVNGTITLKRALPQLLEPPASSQANQSGMPTSGTTGPTNSGDMRKRIMSVWGRVYPLGSRYAYEQTRPYPPSLFGTAAERSLDCSAFVTLIYKEAGAPDPNKNHYDGYGYTGTLVPNGRRVSKADAQPGDMAFYGGSASVPGHVALYLGNGNVGSHGSPGIHKEAWNYRSDFLFFMTFDLGTTPGSGPNTNNQHLPKGPGQR